MTQLSDQDHKAQMADMASFDEQMPCIGIFWYDPLEHSFFGVHKKEIMQIYEVRISHGARADMAELRKFLKSMMTVEGAIRYANNMREEIKTLAFYADLYGKTTSMTLRQIHPEARRMVSHNRNNR